MRIAHHPLHARDGGDFRGRSLSVTARHQDLAGRIVAMDAADGGACVMIRRSSDSASIEDYDVGIPWIGGASQPAVLELPRDRCSVSLRRPATEVLDVVVRHWSIIAAGSGGTPRVGRVISLQFLQL